jgi:DNA-binding PadR family transcriptional regulator
MFGKRLAYEFYGWHDEEPFLWQRAPRPPLPPFWRLRQARRFFGPHGPGPQRPLNDVVERLRIFGRGDLKYALLELLQERPMHGYEMMKVLEERAGGFYIPSPGSVYPTLQMLEDRGLVSASEVEGRKVYTITDAGRAFLAEHSREAGEAGPRWSPGHGPGGRGRAWSPELQALRQEVHEVTRLFMIAGRTAVNQPEQLARLRAVIERTRKDLAEMIYGSSASASPSTEGASEPGETPPATPPQQ